VQADTAQALRMVADIGGTNTRIGRFNPDDDTLGSVTTFTNRDYSSLQEVIAHWLNALEEKKPTVGCLAVAAPLSTDRVDMVNMDWSFSRQEIAAQFDFQQITWLNDFEANAHALPYLTREGRRSVHPGRDGAAGKLATLGPGTGLGGATLQWFAGQPQACSSEPGHMGLAAATLEELELFRAAQPQGGEIYTELLVSGPGLQRIYRALGQVRGEQTNFDFTPADISRLALGGKDLLCTRALETFCALLGSVCGDFILANGAYGGLYLAGGIVPRLGDFLDSSEFHHRLTGKGAMENVLLGVPVYVITAPQPGLIGAAHAPL
jgi:glucokinase